MSTYDPHPPQGGAVVQIPSPGDVAAERCRIAIHIDTFVRSGAAYAPYGQLARDPVRFVLGWCDAPHAITVGNVGVKVAWQGARTTHYILAYIESRKPIREVWVTAVGTDRMAMRHVLARRQYTHTYDGDHVRYLRGTWAALRQGIMRGVLAFRLWRWARLAAQSHPSQEEESC